MEGSLWSGEILTGNGAARRIDWPENRGGGLFLRSGPIVPLKPVKKKKRKEKAGNATHLIGEVILTRISIQIC